MGKVGLKAMGARRGKVYNARHGHGCKRSCNAAEKALETKVRHQGKLEIRAQLT